MSRSSVPITLAHGIFTARFSDFPIIAQSYREARASYKLDLALDGGAQIELFSFPNPPPRASRPEACGLRHLAFAVERLDARAQALRECGVAVEACESMRSPASATRSSPIRMDCRSSSLSLKTQ